MADDVVDRMGLAIDHAEDRITENFGLFDYSYGKKPGEHRDKPHVVRNYNLERQEIFSSNNAGEARQFYDRTCRVFKAKAALSVLSDPANISDEMADAALANQGLARDDFNRPWIRQMLAAALRVLTKE